MSAYKSYQDTNFVAGDSPNIIDAVIDLAKITSVLNIKCDGAGDIDIKLSFDGTDYEDTITVKNSEEYGTNLGIAKIKILHTGTDSSYRIYIED